MSSPNPETYDDRLLTRYLLGALPPEETERLDELSIVDDELASRLNAVENDLVDAFVHNELPEIDVQKLTSFYLSSAKRRRKVEFAQALQGFKNPALQTETPAIPAAVASAPAIKKEPRPKRPFFSLAVRPWAYVAVALVGALISSYIIYRDIGLQGKLQDIRAEQAKSVQRQQELEQKLKAQQAATADTNKQLEQARTSAPNLDQLKTVALLLPPPTRGTTRISTLSVPAGTDLAVLILTLESDDFPAYRAALKDPGLNHVLWQNESLESSVEGDKKAVNVSFPTSLLKSQNYLLELTGLKANGRVETVGVYPFGVVLK